MPVVGCVLLSLLLALAGFSHAYYIPFNRSSFPSDFIFGVGSAAYQSEGAALVDGRGPSIWDTFVRKSPGKIWDHSTGDTANDFYHRYKDDVKLMKKIGLDTLRFSISWSTLLPKGKLSEGVNPLGVKFYNNLINELLSNESWLRHCTQPRAQAAEQAQQAQRKTGSSTIFEIRYVLLPLNRFFFSISPLMLHESLKYDQLHLLVDLPPLPPILSPPVIPSLPASSSGVFVTMGKFPYYVVIKGRKPGIYSTWEECKAQVDGYHSAVYRGCYSEEEAIGALTSGVKTTRSTEAIMERLKRPDIAQDSSSTENKSSAVTNLDDLKVIKKLFVICLITLITLVALVVILIAVVVRLYLM